MLKSQAPLPPPDGSIIGRSKGGGHGDPCPHWASKFFQFHVVFGRNWQNCVFTHLSTPTGGFTTPPAGNPGSTTDLVFYLLCGSSTRVSLCLYLVPFCAAQSFAYMVCVSKVMCVFVLKKTQKYTEKLALSSSGYFLVYLAATYAVWGKLMFSQACIILFTGEVCLWREGLPGGGGLHGGGSSWRGGLPGRGLHEWSRTPPPLPRDTVNRGSIRILLECILIFVQF